MDCSSYKSWEEKNIKESLYDKYFTAILQLTEKKPRKTWRLWTD